ncbi:MAG: hypothetical protein KAG62_14260 [Caulobacter sp.]|nr:hypothetical protein [Caulobacter sp.]
MTSKGDKMADTHAPDAGGTSRAYARYALGLLLLVYVINYVDRQVL